MNKINLISQKLADPLLTFKIFERVIAIFCISIPLFLFTVDDSIPHSFRPSISDYVYMKKSYIFGLLLTVAAMLFIFNGAVYYKNEERLNISWHGQWYNIVLGISLIGVICFPYKEHSIPHYFFAGIFFLGNALVTGIFYKDTDKKKSISLAILTLLAFILYKFQVIVPSILVAEWISLSVIGIHFFLTTLETNSPVNKNDATDKK